LVGAAGFETGNHFASIRCYITLQPLLAKI
jgi:hypothetical protein